MNNELLILLLSSGFIIIGVALWRKANRLLAKGKITDAIIFKNNYQSSNAGDRDGTYHPVVRFLTDKQEWITQELKIGYSSAKEEGTKLQVIYDPEDPTKVEIKSTIQLELIPRLFVALGIGGLVFAALEYLDITELI